MYISCVCILCTLATSCTYLALQASSAAEYEALMLRPPAYDPAYHGSRAEAIGDVDGASFDSACAFAVACVAAGLELTATCVDTPGVDANRVKDKAAELGATKFKVRPWHGAA